MFVTRLRRNYEIYIVAAWTELLLGHFWPFVKRLILFWDIVKLFKYSQNKHDTLYRLHLKLDGKDGPLDGRKQTKIIKTAKWGKSRQKLFLKYFTFSDRVFTSTMKFSMVKDIRDLQLEIWFF